jgi:hypothetical protein
LEHMVHACMVVQVGKTWSYKMVSRSYKLAIYKLAIRGTWSYKMRTCVRFPKLENNG